MYLWHGGTCTLTDLGWMLCWKECFFFLFGREKFCGSTWTWLNGALSFLEPLSLLFTFRWSFCLDLARNATLLSARDWLYYLSVFSSAPRPPRSILHTNPTTPNNAIYPQPTTLNTIEWKLVQFKRSSWNHHVRFGMAADDLLGRYRHTPHYYRRHSRSTGDDLQLLVCHGTGESRQNITHRSRQCSHSSHSQRTSTAHEGFSQHVRSVSDIQTAPIASLSDLQQVYLTHGPSLSVDE